MKQGKYQKIVPVRRRRTKPTLLLACIALILCLSIGGTLAYIVANSGTVNNEFVPAQVSCEVINGSTISVKNTSDIPAYLRATYVVNWMDSDGNVSGTSPDASVEVASEWASGGDGFYYYNGSVAVDESKSFIISYSASGTAPSDDYTLTVEVVAEAIQAEGMGASSASEAWAKADD